MSTGASQPASEHLASDTVWYGSLAVATLTVLGSLAVLAIILSGATDPQPVGELRIDDPVSDRDIWPDLIILPDSMLGFAIDSVWTTHTSDIPEPFSAPGTIEVSLRQVSGPPEAAYGLTWHNDDTTLIIKLNANGYLGITRTQPDSTPHNIYTWRPFPHVRGIDQTNHIWISVAGDHAVVRINDEVAAEFDDMPDGLYQVSWYAETFEEGGLEVAIEHFRLWADQ